jgi:predicted site-specific integrase-resolvase
MGGVFRPKMTIFLNDIPDWMEQNDAARFFNVSVSTIRRWRKAGIVEVQYPVQNCCEIRTRSIVNAMLGENLNVKVDLK